MGRPVSRRGWESDLSKADEAVQRRLFSRREAIAEEVRRLLDAGLDLMTRDPSAGPPRVADIVAAAGSSNDAFYRAFGSRDAFVVAIVDDGARRLLSYLQHQRDLGTDPADQLRRCIAGVLSQATNPEIASATRAVIAATPTRRSAEGVGGSKLADELGRIFEDPLRALGSPEPRRDGTALARVVLGEMESALWAARTPTARDTNYLCGVALRLAGGAVR